MVYLPAQDFTTFLIKVVYLNAYIDLSIVVVWSKFPFLNQKLLSIKEFQAFSKLWFQNCSQDA